VLQGRLRQVYWLQRQVYWALQRQVYWALQQQVYWALQQQMFQELRQAALRLGLWQVPQSRPRGQQFHPQPAQMTAPSRRKIRQQEVLSMT
jgi:hypothetical protein